jgi:hypothetical protein
MSVNMKTFEFDQSVCAFLGIPFEHALSDEELLRLENQHKDWNDIVPPWNAGLSGVFKHTEETKDRMREAALQLPDEKHDAYRGRNNYQSIGLWCTPWGRFESARDPRIPIGSGTVKRWCKKSSEKITNRAWSMSPYLQELGTKETIVGQTYGDIGFNLL